MGTSQGTSQDKGPAFRSGKARAYEAQHICCDLVVSNEAEGDPCPELRMHIENYGNGGVSLLAILARLKLTITNPPFTL
jgi:hypothetical protein